MSKPVVEREGDDLIFSWPEQGVRIRVESIKDAHDELRAELTVESTTDGESGTLWWGGLNLKATRSRAEVANALYARLALEEFWQDALLHVSVKTKRAHREGSPPVNLATVAHAAETAYLVSHLLPLGENTVIYGDGMAGKSAFLRAVCLAILTETPLHRMLDPLGSTRVLWLDWETNEAASARWFSRLAAGMGLSECPEITYKRMLRPVQDEAAYLRRYVAAEGFGLVCADSLALACGGDPRDPGVAVAAMNAFHSLETTVAILAHISKGEAQAGGPSSIFGSIMFRNEARSTWELQATEGMPPGEHAITLYHRKSNDDQLIKTPIGLRFLFQPRGGPITVSDYDALRNVAAARGLSARQKLAALLDETPRTVYELADLAGLDNETTARRLREMQGMEAERIEPAAEGRGQVVHWRKAAKAAGKGGGAAFGDSPTSLGGARGSRNGLSADAEGGDYGGKEGGGKAAEGGGAIIGQPLSPHTPLTPELRLPPAGTTVPGVITTPRARGDDESSFLAEPGGSALPLVGPVGGETDEEWFTGIGSDYAKEFEPEGDELDQAPF